MKVCIFTETFHPVIGGGETQARLLAEGLEARGFEVIVLTRRSSAELPARDTVGTVPVLRLGPSGGGQLKKWGLVFSGLPALIRLRRAYDVVFVSGFRILGIPAVLAARLLGKGVVLKADCEGEMSGEFFAPGLARAGVSVRSWPVRGLLTARNALLRRADAYAAISASVAAELREARVDPALIHDIPNAVDTKRFSPASPEQKLALRRRLGLPEHARILVYTGRLVSYKGLPLLLRIWPAVRAAHPDALLLLVGTGGLDIHACEPELRAEVRDNDLAQSIRFTGSVQNVPDYLQASDLFVFPTENDAFPSSVVEAMACALPVVATPVGAIKEILRDGENGLLVEPRDGAGLSRALDRLLADPVLAGRLGSSGLQTVQERYSAERVTRRYAELFSRVAARLEAAAPGAH